MEIDKRVGLIGIMHAMLAHGHALGFVLDVLGEALRCEGMADLMILWTDTAAGAVDRHLIIQSMRQHLDESKAFRAGTFDPVVATIKENESGLGLLDDAMREARDLDDDNQKPVVPVAMIHSEVTMGSVEQFIETCESDTGLSMPGSIRKGVEIRDRGPATVYVLLRALADAHKERRKPFASQRYTALAERLLSTGMVK